MSDTKRVLTTAEELVHDDANRPNIHALRDLGLAFIVERLGGHVEKRALPIRVVI